MIGAGRIPQPRDPRVARRCVGGADSLREIAAVVTTSTPVDQFVRGWHDASGRTRRQPPSMTGRHADAMPIAWQGEE